MNISILSGNLTRDVELIQTKSEWSILKFTLANNDEYRDGQTITSFVDCECFTNKPQQYLARMVKGAKVQVTGAIKQDTWEKDGQKHSKIKVAVQSRPFPQIEFIARRDEPVEVKDEFVQQVEQEFSNTDDIPF